MVKVKDEEVGQLTASPQSDNLNGTSTGNYSNVATVPPFVQHYNTSPANAGGGSSVISVMPGGGNLNIPQPPRKARNQMHLTPHMGYMRPMQIPAGHHYPPPTFPPHFHHWTFPPDMSMMANLAAAPPSAIFHFGPGFEHHGGVRYPGIAATTTTTSSTSSNSSTSSKASTSSNSSRDGQQNEHVVHFHVNPGVTVSFQIGDSTELIRGPVTVPMVSTNSQPPIAMPVQVPAGHFVQQIVDESGTLRHVILSPQPPLVPMPPQHTPQPHYGPGNGTTQAPHQTYYQQALPPPNGSYGPPPAHYLLANNGNGSSGASLNGHSTTSSSGAGSTSSSVAGHHSPSPPSFHNERAQRQYNKLKRKLEQKNMRNHGAIAATSGQWHGTNGTNMMVLSPRRDLVNGLSKRAGGNNYSNSNTTILTTNNNNNMLGSTGSSSTGSINERRVSSVGTSEDGEEENSSFQDDDEDDDDVTYITDILSSVQAPQLCNLTSRSALFQWSVPERLSDSASGASSHEPNISEADLRYEVLLSTDKAKEGKYKSIYSGASLSCLIRDLKPGQEYLVCLQVHLDELQGTPSEPVTFRTPACEPDQPAPPKLISRTKTSLLLRWTIANDNGAHIIHYILEYNGGNDSDEFVELLKSKGRQQNLQKLSPQTSYKFRLAAVNECGKSAYSDVVSFSTAGMVPPQPNAPSLHEAGISQLHLKWEKRTTDDNFTLQLDEYQSSATKTANNGYLPVYYGQEAEYVCTKLKRATKFKFRLRAHNEEGDSRWSDEVYYCTLADKPSPPIRLSVKGKIQAHHFKVKWEPPNDKGGADIKQYVLELSNSSTDMTAFAVVYRGADTEANCDKLQPGTTYYLRVYCTSGGGQSDYSDIFSVTTECVCPNQCDAPKLNGKPKPNQIPLKWSVPTYDGGAPVLEYHVEQTNADAGKSIVYRGTELDCVVGNLLPGTTYKFAVKAINRIGSGLWSDALQITSGAGAPDAPAAPELIPRSPFVVFVKWNVPKCNGANVSEYRLEIGSSDHDDNFSSIFQGGATSYDVKNLAPCTLYFFRVQACNAAGCSDYSQISSTTTPASTPGPVQITEFETTPKTIKLYWTQPVDNGSKVLHYNIELGDKQVISTKDNGLEHTLNNLTPETNYKIKVQAVNAIGAGPFSAGIRVSTPPLPPAPPKLECVGVAHNYIKLKWGEGKNLDFTRYFVEMYNPRTKEYQDVYQGTSFTCKVNKLQEATTYKFRICAENDRAGEGDFSDPYDFQTSYATPSTLKAPKLVELLQQACTIEWNAAHALSAHKTNAIHDQIVYAVQLTRVRDQDCRQVYKGCDTRATIDDLEAGVEYHVRVCPIRVIQSVGETLHGVYSPPLVIVTPAVASDVTDIGSVIANAHASSLSSLSSITTSTSALINASFSHSANNSPTRSRKMHQQQLKEHNQFVLWLNSIRSSEGRSDTQTAVLIIVGFLIFAILFAVLVEQFIIWRQSV